MHTSTQHADAKTVESDGQSRRQLLTTAGAGLILISGVIHLGLVPEHLEEATYLGVLFAVDFVATAVAAVGIYRTERWGWWLGVAITVVALVLYVVHGTVGLPVVGAEELVEPAGVVTKIVELLYLGVAAAWIRGD